MLRRGPALSRVAYLLTGDHRLAEDLLQTALTRSVPRWSRLAARSGRSSRRPRTRCPGSYTTGGITLVSRGRALAIGVLDPVTFRITEPVQVPDPMALLVRGGSTWY